ncbi:MAG: replicative DNA helicase [Clostridia bacterium]|nr:replicative DNA helicase [Clostridia bacterium]
MAKKTLNNNLVMPHSIESEQALLGCILVDARIQIEISAFLSEDDFYIESHKYIFNAMSEIIKENQPVDLVTLTDKLEKQGVMEKVGGIDYIVMLTNVLPASANYNVYLDIVLRDSMLRKIIKGSTEIISNCSTSQNKNEALAHAEKTIFDIANTADTSSLVPINKILPSVMNNIDELSKNAGGFRGIRTGYNGLDEIINGLNKSDLLILAARPAVGKTSLAMNIVENVALQGYSVAVFSLEMSKEQLGQRMVCSISNVSMKKVNRGQMTKAEWLALAKGKEALAQTKIYINDSAIITPAEIQSFCRRLQRRQGLDFIVIDYLQLMSSKKKFDNRQQEVTDISRNLKILAKELNVPVLVLSQLSRAVEERKGRPQMSDLRESGAIEQDADIVMFIHKPDKYAKAEDIESGKVKQGVVELIVEKNRSGAQGTIELFFRGECTKFVNIAEDGVVDNFKPTSNTRVGLEEIPSKKEEKAETEEPEFNVEKALPNVEVPFEEEAPSSIDDEIF